MCFSTGHFWSRLLTALDAANLFATSMDKIGGLHLVMANPGVWRIAHTDIYHLSARCGHNLVFAYFLEGGGGLYDHGWR